MYIYIGINLSLLFCMLKVTYKFAYAIHCNTYVLYGCAYFIIVCVMCLSVCCVDLFVYVCRNVFEFSFACICPFDLYMCFLGCLLAYVC